MTLARTLFVSLLMVAAASSFAAVPQLINYQGQLTASDGTPLDTTVAMTFVIYDAVTGGANLWTETHSPVAVENGLFHVQLGSITTLNDLFTTACWLGVTVGNNTEMTPRQQLVSVAHAYRVGTVDGANGGTITNKLNVGTGNTNAGNFANVQGENNTASGNYATVGGGRFNFAHAAWSVVGGGGGFFGAFDSNSVRSESGTIGGGRRNFCAFSPGGGATIGGGIGNSATWDFATVAGGVSNIAGSQSFVGGGSGNEAPSSGAVIAGGTYNNATGTSATISGGNTNTVSTYLASIGGGQGNQSSGLAGTVGGGRYNRARGSYSVVGGGGGGSQVDSNSATGDNSTIAGGARNAVSGLYGTVGGGYYNTVFGEYGAVPGGGLNQAGPYSFAAGYGAQANHIESFVWGDGTEFTNSFGLQTVTFRCSGGARFYTAAGTSTGVQLASGGGSWSSLSDSSQKENRKDVNTTEVLDRLKKLKISEWNYRSQDDQIRHMGPMAQDFQAAFGLGENNTTITTVDADGVLMAAIQELTKENEARKAMNDELNNEVRELRTIVQTLMASSQKASKEER